MAKRSYQDIDAVKRICIDVVQSCKRNIEDYRNVKRLKITDESHFDKGYTEGYEDCITHLDEKLCRMLTERFNAYIQESNRELFEYLNRQQHSTFYVY
ncbi:MAG: hypothetical protein CMB64_04860 [Euryarchaeota archaeon]|nr:hypothetical protein [Euryarchaeota archaeon]